METVTMPQVHKSGGLIGAEVRGLDLTRQYPDATYQAILRAWAEHGVIFLRDQHLTAGQRDAFASRLGEIRVRQEVRKEPEQTKAIGEGWHTDMTCFEEPPKATMLFCEEVPAWGGDTQWAAMGPTFEALSAGLQATLLGLSAIHAGSRGGPDASRCRCSTTCSPSAPVPSSSPGSAGPPVPSRCGTTGRPGTSPSTTTRASAG
jgi:alpha-ketoglutarate-dependent taurine dioxygenase